MPGLTHAFLRYDLRVELEFPGKTAVEFGKVLLERKKSFANEIREVSEKG